MSRPFPTGSRFGSVALLPSGPRNRTWLDDCQTETNPALLNNLRTFLQDRLGILERAYS